MHLQLIVLCPVNFVECPVDSIYALHRDDKIQLNFRELGLSVKFFHNSGCNGLTTSNNYDETDIIRILNGSNQPETLIDQIFLVYWMCHSWADGDLIKLVKFLNNSKVHFALTQIPLASRGDWKAFGCESKLFIHSLF